MLGEIRVCRLAFRAARTKIDTTGAIWPVEIIAALQEQAARTAARHAAIAEANRRNQEIYIERTKFSLDRSVPVKKINRAEIHDTAASRPGVNSLQFANETIGLRDRRKRVDFIARSGEQAAKQPSRNLTVLGARNSSLGSVSSNLERKSRCL